MHKIVSGTYSGGVIELKQPLELPNGAEVEIEIRTVSEAVRDISVPATDEHQRRNQFLKTIREFTDKYPDVFKNLKFTREELHERR